MNIAPVIAWYAGTRNLKLANQKSRVRREWAAWFWRWRCAVTRCRAWRKLLRIRCIAVQKRAVQFTKKPYLPLFSSETADKFAKDYAIKKSFRHALHLVTAHLHRQNQVAHALLTRDFWLASLSMHFPIIIITLLVGEKLCRVNNIINIINIMFEYLGLAYRNSAYTAVIAIMPWPECKKLVLKLTLVVEMWALLSRRGRHCSSALYDFRWQYRS